MGLSVNHDEEYCRKLAAKIPYRLLSCFTSYVGFAKSWANFVREENPNKEITLLLDSGAFTAWNKGVVMTLEDLLPVYYEFMMEFWGICKEIYLINLDKIPGSPGRTADNTEIEECLKVSDENYNILVKEFGNRVLPVFHQGESSRRLLELEQISNYLCISPRNDLPEKYRVSWSREVHGLLKKDTMTHGLATTGSLMMETVSWKSVDSATWMFIASTGSVTLNVKGKLKNIGISEKSSDRHTLGKHFRNLPSVTKKEISKIIESRGYSIEELETNDGARCAITMEEINDWVENNHEFKESHNQGLFDL